MVRVGVIGDAWEDSFTSNVMAGLTELGVEPVWLGTLHRHVPGRLKREILSMTNRVPRIAARQQRSIVEAAREAAVDLIISIESWLQPKTVADLRAIAPIVLWYPDPLSTLASHMMLACDYNRIYFKDPLLVERLRALLDIPVSYLPEACNPALHRPLVDYGTGPGLVIPGNMYPVRFRLVERLVADEVPIRFYGTGFPPWLPYGPLRDLFQGREVWGQEKARVMRSATAVLNNLHIGEMSSVNCRLFDGAGSGAVVLCEDRPALRDLFEVGTEVLAFSSYSELLDQYRWLVDHPDEAGEIGDAAARRAHAEHTHAHRLRGVLQDSI